MPPKKRNSGNTQSKGQKTSAESASPDKKESPELSVKKHRDKDAEYVTLCKSLHVTDLVCDHAWNMWKTVQESMDEVAECQKKLWGACLFVTVTDMDVACFTLTQVLKAVSLNVKQFMALVRKLDVNLDTISTKVHSALTRLEKKYDVTLALYQRFEKTCKKIFALVSDGKERETMRSCWTMFLLAKGRVLQMEDDLVISFQLLLCTLELFIKRGPPDLLQPLYKSAISKVQSPPTRTSRRNQSKAKSRPPEPEVDVQLLETLCKENECNAEEVKNVYQTSFSAFLDSLDLSRSPDFPQVNDLDQQYEEHYLKSRDIDGRLFFDGDETVRVPKVEIQQVERTPKKNLPDEDSVVIPPQTPIRAAMTSIQQLRGELISTGDQPSAILDTYFKNCTVDPTQDVLKRLETLEQAFSQRFGQAVGPRCVVLGKQRFTLGVRLYYKVMEAMLKSEEKRLSVQNFSKLLNDSTFHTSLLACSLEVVMATYGESSFKTGGYIQEVAGGDPTETDVCFPWILDVFNLAAFDFYKVIESFIKADPTMSKDIVKHLETCENLIMERIAWRRGSPLFELLKQEHEGGAAEQLETPASFSQPLQHNHTAADLYLSPMRPGHRVLPPEFPVTASSQASAQVPTQPASQTPRHPKSNSLSLFYKKLYRLAYTRLKILCSYLLPSHPELEPIIWTLFQHTLQHEYELMRDRHLDQLMMSAMYAICKVKTVDLRFKTIVTAYKNMPNTNQETFKHVLITEGHYDSIIVFYNQVFMQRLKTNILQYASTRPPTLSPIPQIPRSPYKFPNSPLRVPGSNNVYISPLKSPRMSPGIMTPHSRMLVSIGESFGLSSRFQKINQMVNSSNRSCKRTLDLGSAPKPLKRLRFDVDGQDESDGSKSGGDSTLIQKLAEMSSTRSRMQEQKMKEDAEARKE
ncbi:retinoblastoma-associated protein [Xiphias gladius]|uniref:retinoblastoma-associated protein n=1 Tax=Xiphias gladius TaxID=8245 RepID=UPI001A99F090|nr:retinoblastoma-associated protein [Xiphias gladius]XP_040006253.1 retinoblastoma-associated protein [Xiphias gladius]XP_040006254.1 retinoblastoma-associated protein [Xiphias gladius]XP_040006255.1 retinoblastoma-associated protein [Xiphias gladius]